MTQYVDHKITKVDAMLEIGATDPQVAFSIAQNCFASNLLYIARCVSIHRWQAAAEKYDDHVHETCMRILGFSATQLTTDGEKARYAQAKAISALPKYLGGLGHSRITDHGPGAYLGSLAGAHRDRTFCAYRETLGPYVTLMHAAVLQRLLLPTENNDKMRARLAADQQNGLHMAFPSDPEAWTQGEHFPNRLYPGGHDAGVPVSSKKLKVQRTINSAINKATQIQIIIATADTAKTPQSHPHHIFVRNPFRNNELTTTLQADDRAHILSLLLKGKMHHIHYLPLHVRSLTLKPEQFRLFTRWLLNLPPIHTTNNTTYDNLRDLHLQFCTNIDIGNNGHGCPNRTDNDSRPLLGPTGQHSVHCHRNRAAQMMHNILVGLMKGMNDEGGGTGTDEPDNNELNGVPPGVPFNVFPPSTAKAQMELVYAKVAELAGELKVAYKKNDSDLVGSLNAQIRRATNKLSFNTARRADLHLISDRGKEVIIDVCATSHVRASKCKANEKHLTTLANQTLILSLNDPLQPAIAPADRIDHKDPTPGVHDSVTRKNNTYYHFMSVLNYKRPVAGYARFLPVIFSHAGEFSQGTIDALNFIQETFMRTASRGPRRRDGTSTKTVGQNFKERNTNKLIHCLAIGVTDMLRTAGRPYHASSRY